MRVAGATMALALTTLPVRSPRWKRLVRKVHIKYEALTETSLRRYQVAVKRFVLWRRSAAFPFPISLQQLDFKASEYINLLYFDEV